MQHDARQSGMEAHVSNGHEAGGVAGVVPSRVVSGFLAATLGLVLWIGPDMVNARSDMLPVLRLSCGDAPDGMCRSMQQTLAARTDGRFTIQLVGQPDVTPEHAGDLAVSVVVDGRGQDWIAVHLEWQHGPDGARAKGPSLELGVMDAALTQRMYDRFADSLVLADAEMATLLEPEPHN